MFYNFRWIRKPDFRNITDIDYDEYWRVRGFHINNDLKPRETIMLSLVEPGSKVMDIGCGTSRLPLAFSEKGCSVSIADISQLVLDEYQKLGIKGRQIDLDQIHDIDLSDLEEDYIVMSEVLEHTRNPEEIIECLSPHSTYFLLTVPNSGFIWFRLNLLFRGRFFTQWVYHPSEHLRFWTHIDFLDWLDAMNLDLIGTWPSNGTRVVRNWWPNMFGWQMVYFCKIRR